MANLYKHLNPFESHFPKTAFGSTIQNPLILIFNLNPLTIVLHIKPFITFQTLD